MLMLTWLQRLWSQTLTPAVTALAWRPDGNQVVAGCADGNLHTIDTELGEVTAVTQMSKARITGDRLSMLLIFHFHSSSCSS